MTKDLAPPRQDLGGFVRWPAPGADDSTLTVTFGSWLALIPVAFLVLMGLVCLTLPFLAITMPMPGQPALTLENWFSFLAMWLLSALIFYGARLVLRMVKPSWLNLDLAARRYVLWEGFRPNRKVWTGDFDDIQKIYIWTRWERSNDRYIYNINISWAMRSVVTSLWTYTSKKPDDPKPEAWAENFCQELGVPFGGVLTGKYSKTWKSP